MPTWPDQTSLSAEAKTNTATTSNSPVPANSHAASNTKQTTSQEPSSETDCLNEAAEASTRPTAKTAGTTPPAGPPDPAEAGQKTMDRVDRSEPTDAELVALVAGLRLTPLAVLGQGPGRVVVQARDEQGRQFVMKADERAGAFDGDVHANARLAALGVPVPTIETHRPGPPAVLLLRWVDGKPLTSSSPLQAQHEAGRILRRIHRAEGPPPYSGQPSICEWIMVWTAEIADRWAAYGAPDQANDLRRWARNLRPLLLQRTGRLTLFDGRPDHWLVHQGQIAGVIDLHDLQAGDPAMDLAVLTLSDQALLPAVLTGYEESASEQAHFEDLVPFFTHLRRVSGAEWHLRHGEHQQGMSLLHRAVHDFLDASTS